MIRPVRILSLAGALALLVVAAMALLTATAPPAQAHSGPHDPTAGSTITFRGGLTLSDCQSKVPGAVSCPKFTITNCQGATESRDGWYARQNPLSGTATKVMVIFSGGGGQKFWQDQAKAGSPEDKRVDQFITDLRSSGFMVLQVKWGVDWFKADSGQDDGLHVACRPARILKYLYNERFVQELGNPSHATGTCGFCIMGTSGGSTAVSWMMTHFMAETDVDAAFPTGGPPHGDMAKGCIKSTPGSPDYAYYYGDNGGPSIQQVDNPFQGANQPCLNHDASFKSTWDAHSIAPSQAGGDQNHPTTRIHLIDGTLDLLRFHGWGWMSQMWKEPNPSAYTTFEVVPGHGHSIYDTDQGMAALKAAVLKTTAPKACGNGVDDDWDGLVDAADPGCSGTGDASEKGTTSQCDDGIDNDGDGFIDFQVTSGSTNNGDPGCSGPSDNTEAGSDPPPQPSLSISNAGGNEGNAGTSNFTFTVTASPAPTAAVSVNYATSDVQATAQGPFPDYSARSGTLNFAAGETTKSIVVPVNGDTLFEPTETFTVGLSGASGAAIQTGTGVGTITNDDPQPSFSVSDATVMEGPSQQAQFTVTLSGASTSPIQVTASTQDGTAKQPSDYEQKSTVVPYAAGASGPQIVTVAINDDDVPESSETFTLNLSGATGGAVISRAQGLGTLNDNDPDRAVSIASPGPIQETNGSLVFPVTLSGVSGKTVTVDYATSPGSATAGSDYTHQTGTLTFNPDQTSKNVSVAVLHDTLDEDDETFTVTLSNPTNASIVGGPATGTIADNDTAVLVIQDAGVTEGNPPDTPAMVFNVTLSTASSRQITAQVNTADGTATAPGDYTALPGGNPPLTFAAGETLKTVVVTVIGDEDVEENETFTVNLSNTAGLELGAHDLQAIGTIVNDDSGPTVGVAGPTEPVAEGDPPANVVVDFTVTLSKAASQNVTVDYATASGTATEGSDFESTSGMLEFEPGQLEKTVSVPVIEDVHHEPDESFTLNLSNVTGDATLGVSQATGMIGNDDPQSILSVSDAGATEGGLATFEVTLTPAPTMQTTVSFSTTNGTAVAPGDFTAISSQPVVFNAGEGSKNVDVTTIADGVDEDEEAFGVTVSSSDPAVAGGDTTGVGTITDGDPEPSLSIAGPASPVSEGDTATFTVTLSPASGKTVTVDYLAAPGTAQPDDFQPTSGTLTFTPGQTSRSVNVPTVEDVEQESDETILVGLSNPGNATLDVSQAEAIIADDDDTPTLSILDAEPIAEGDPGDAQRARFMLSLSQPLSEELQVTFETQPGTATPDVDYDRRGITVRIAAGKTTRPVPVDILGDTVDEDDETFLGVISGAPGVVIADNTGTATILDDDEGAPPPPPGVTVSIEDESIAEGDAKTRIKLKVRLSEASTQTVTADYATSDGTAAAGPDYLARSGTLSFSPGQTVKNVIIVIRGDTVPEPNETFFVTISNATNATIVDEEAIGTILNDD